MAIAQLDNLVRIGKMKSEPPVQIELDGLVRSGSVRLKDAENDSLSLQSRFDLAYNAAHALALAALRHHGYRSDNRYLVFQSLQHTLKLPLEEWRVLDQAHNKRNRSEYRAVNGRGSASRCEERPREGESAAESEVAATTVQTRSDRGGFMPSSQGTSPALH